MFNRNDVSDALASKGITPVGSIVDNPDKERSYLVFLKKRYDDDGNQHPSKGQISSVMKMLQEEGVGIVFALIDEKAIEINNAVGAMLSDKFLGKVRNSVVSLENGEALVSVDIAKDIAEEDIINVKLAVEEILGYLGVTIVRFVLLTTLPTATVTACVAMIRKHAPVTIEELSQKLISAGFEPPNKVWLNNTLDRWRRNGLLLRRSDKRFVLTFDGLNKIGTRRNRTSPDISRALAIGRFG